MPRNVAWCGVLVLVLASCGEEAADETPDGGGSRSDGGLPAPGGPGGTAASCGTFSTGSDFLVCASTYLTGAGEDVVGGVAFGAGGELVYGGTIHEGNFGATPRVLLGGGAAGVVRLSGDARAVRGVTRLGATVRDVDVDAASGVIVVAGSFGVAALSPDAAELRFSDGMGGAEAQRVAVGSDGTVAALAGKKVWVWDASGAARGSFDVGGAAAVNDVAVHGGAKRVVVVGFKQDDGPPCSMLQIPFVRAFDYDGAAKWKMYDWNRTEVGAVNECADTRGVAVAVGRDGALYYAGESHGGNTVHRRQPRDLAAMAPVVKFDKYNDPYNMNGAAPVGFYARVDATTGAIVKGQFAVTRLSDGKGNAVRPRAIAADERGTMVIGGGAACCIEGGATRTVNGAPAMPSYAGGGMALVVSADFTKRLAWTAWNGATGGGADGVSVAAGEGGMGIALLHAPIKDRKPAPTADAPLLTTEAILAAPGGGNSDGLVSTWPAP